MGLHLYRYIAHLYKSEGKRFKNLQKKKNNGTMEESFTFNYINMAYTFFNPLYSIQKYMEAPGESYYRGFESQKNDPKAEIDPKLKTQEQSYNKILADMIKDAESKEKPNEETIRARIGLSAGGQFNPFTESRIIVNPQWQFTMKSFWFDTAFRIDNNKLTLPWIQKEIPVGSTTEALEMVHAINTITHYSRNSMTSANNLRYSGKDAGLAPEVFFDTKTGEIKTKGVIKDGVIMKSRFSDLWAEFIVDAINTRSNNVTQRMEEVMLSNKKSEEAKWDQDKREKKQQEIDKIKWV